MANTNTITKRNIYTALIAMVDNGQLSDTFKGGEGDKAYAVTPANIKTFAQSEIALLDKRNTARASKPSKASAENASLALDIANMFKVGEIVTASEVGVKAKISTAKASAVLKGAPALFENLGKVVKGKSGKVVGYKVLGLDTPTEGDPEGDPE